MNEEREGNAQPQGQSVLKTGKEVLRRYKIPLAVAAAVIGVGISAAVHYKNDRMREKLARSIEEYRRELMPVGGELRYDDLGCSGVFSTECTVRGIAFSMMGEEQLSIQSLRLGKMEELEALKRFGKGESVSASVDIEIEGMALPKPVVAQIVSQNVSDPFQHYTLEQLNTIGFALEAEISGSPALIETLEIERLRIDNAVMPIEFTMEASRLSGNSPDAMVLHRFSLSAEDRAISDVTYASVAAFAARLTPPDRALFLKEFGLRPSQMEDKAKASDAINRAIAKRFETDLARMSGIVEKEVVRAMIALLRGEADTIILRGENRENHTVGEIQQFLLHSSAMGEEAAKAYMDERFIIEVEAE